MDHPSYMAGPIRKVPDLIGGLVLSSTMYDPFVHAQFLPRRQGPEIEGKLLVHFAAKMNDIWTKPD